MAKSTSAKNMAPGQLQKRYGAPASKSAPGHTTKGTAKSQAPGQQKKRRVSANTSVPMNSKRIKGATNG